MGFGCLSGATPNFNFPFWIGGTPPGSPCIYSIGGMAAWNGYVLTSGDVAALRDGNATPHTIGGTASWRGYWTLGGTTGAVPNVGDPGLANDFGDAAYNLTSITGSGSMVYCDPIVSQPSAGISKAHVGTSGKTVAFFFKSLGNQQETIPLQSLTAPTISINGNSIGSLTNPWITGTHRCAMYTLPSGVQANPGDSVTVSAPQGWMNTAAGITQPATNQAVENCTGRSAMGTDQLTKTLAHGPELPSPRDEHLGALPGQPEHAMADRRFHQRHGRLLWQANCYGCNLGYRYAIRQRRRKPD